MPNEVRGQELSDRLRDKINERDNVIAAPPFSAVGRTWYRESLALLRAIRPGLADRFAHIPFSKDSEHIEPSRKLPDSPHYPQVKEYYIKGVKSCLDLLNEAINEIEFNRTYTLEDAVPSGAAPAARWYQNAAILAPIGVVVGALLAALATVVAAWVNHPKSDDIPKVPSIINSGDRELRTGQATDVFQTKDLIFVGVNSDGRAHVITSGYAPQLGDDFAFADRTFREYTFKHGGKTYLLGLEGPEVRNGDSYLKVRVTEGK
jgi:hypothetical protein